MIDRYRIDSHKLLYHIPRVYKWLKGDFIYPIYIEISPSGACNHRCVFCAYDYIGYKPRFIDAKILRDRLNEMGSVGVRSILYSGEGEPFLHKEIVSIVKDTKRSGIDVAIATNAVLFKKELAEEVPAYLTWLKVSINAGKKETYAKIHRTRMEDFEAVFKNMEYAVKIKRKKNFNCTFGMQILLLPENYNEVTLLARKAKKIGMDYLVVKSYSQHPLSKTKRYKDICYSDYLYLADELKRFNDRDFSVIFRIDTMRKWDKHHRSFKRCYALPFWAHIDASGDVWGCPSFLGNKRFLYGNIYKQTFKEIWRGSKRKKIVDMVEKRLNVERCRFNCRMDEINRYLWELKNPPEHVNFI